MHFPLRVVQEPFTDATLQHQELQQLILSTRHLPYFCCHIHLLPFTKYLMHVSLQIGSLLQDKLSR